jgi:hypothetical protein
MVPSGWQNPITVAAGHVQNVEARLLLPSRHELISQRLAQQRLLVASGRARWTPILVTINGVIQDGHHAIRAAAELGIRVDVKVIDFPLPPSGVTILNLPVR